MKNFDNIKIRGTTVNKKYVTRVCIYGADLLFFCSFLRRCIKCWDYALLYKDFYAFCIARNPKRRGYCLRWQ